MIKIYKVNEARKSILNRQTLDDTTIPESLQQSINRLFEEALTPEQAVARILGEVRRNGDMALRKWIERLDGSAPQNFRVTRQQLAKSVESITPDQLEALKTSAERIRRFYQHQSINSWIMQDGSGTLGQVIRPIKRVGIYVPGNAAPLASTVLMSAVPAQVAGVPEIVVTAPPQRETGQVAPIILAACEILGINEVYSLGGAQAIGALAYGTESIRAVDKIVGPGNLFVTLAKRQVFGVVGIDGLAGPTETIVIADENANPDWVAADLLAQAEHDVLAAAILLTPSLKVAEAVQAQVNRLAGMLPRSDVLSASLSNRSGIVITADLDEAVELSNSYAPEHLCLSVADPWALSEKIDAAGGMFLGESSFEVLGDYNAGPSHVMPTNGTARFASPLNVWDFVHIISLVALAPGPAAQLSRQASVLARAEGLEAHALAAEERIKGSKQANPA